jgi:hypothetical protein
MATAIADEPFRRSYLDFWNYPENLTSAGSRDYKFKLRRYREVIDSIEEDLFHPSGHDDIVVPIRDLYGFDKDIKKRNLKEEQQLEDWLGVSVDKTLDSDDPLVLVRSEQPKCRFM